MASTNLLNLAPGTQYYVQVRSVSGGIPSEWSPIFAFRSDQDLQPPPVPTGLAAVPAATDTDSFQVTWNRPSDPTMVDFKHYEVRATGNGKTQVYVSANESFLFTLKMNEAAFDQATSPVQFAVRSVDLSDNKSEWSPVVTGTNPPPANVTGTTVAAISNGVKIDWNLVADKDVKGYRIYVHTGSAPTGSTTGSQVGEVTGTTYTHGTMTYGTDHYFGVRAVDTFGTTSTGITWAGPVRPLNFSAVDTTPPAAPTALGITTALDANDAAGGTSLITLTWTAPTASDLGGYTVRYATSTSGPWTFIDVPADATTARIPNLVPNQAYHVGIQAYDISRNKSGWANAPTYPITTAADTTAPGQVTGVVVNGGMSSVTVTWNARTESDVINGQGTYEVQLDTANTFNTGNLRTMATGATVLSFTGLSQNTVYYARVRAKDKNGNFGPYSSVASGNTGTVVTNLSDGNAPSSSPAATVVPLLGALGVQWTPVTNPDAVTYDVHLSTASGFTPASGTKVGEVAGTSFIIRTLPGTSTPLSYDTTYYVRLVARDRDGSGPAGTQGSGQISKVATQDFSGTARDLGAVQIFRQPNAPTGTLITGDIWYDTDDGNLAYYYNGSAWVENQDAGIDAAAASAATAITNAQTAQTTANSKIVTFYQDSAPSASGRTTGDLWVDTDDSNKLYRWSGTAWTAVVFGYSALDINVGGTNLVTNSSFEVDSNGDGLADDWYVWARGAGDSARTFSHALVAGHFAGSNFAQRVTTLTVGNTEPSAIHNNKNFPVQGGAQYAIQGSLRALRAGTYTISIRQETNTGGYVGESQVTCSVPADSAPVRYSGIVTTHPTAQRFRVGVTGPSAPQPGDWFELDMIQVEAGNVVTAWGPKPTELLPGVINSAMVNFTARDIGSVTTYRQAAAPTGTLRAGDFWLDSDDGDKLYRYSGSTWELVSDARIVTAINNAATAQSTADGKARIFVQTTAPTGLGPNDVDDLWIDSDDGNHPYRWSGSAWVSVRDATIAAAAAAAAAAQADADQAIADAADAQAAADGKVRTFFQAAEPTGMLAEDVGDLWFDSDDANKMYRWSGTAWVASADTRISQALTDAAAAAAAAGEAQTTADSKITTYYQTSQPTATAIGDLWVDTDDNNRLYRWNGAAWQDARDGTIVAAQTRADDAYSLAGTAKSIADGKIVTFFQSTVPTSQAAGDLWVHTGDGNKAYRANAAAVNTIVTSGNGWYAVQDTAIQTALTNAATAQTAANNALTLDAANPNPLFHDWTGSVPAGWASWGAAPPVKETSIDRTPPHAMRFNVAAAADSHGVQSTSILSGLPINLEYVVVEIDFYLVSGTLPGSGIILDWTGMTNNRTTLSLNSEVPNAQTGKWYRVSKVLRRPTNATGTQTGWGTYIMANWTGLGSAAKNIIFDRVAYRPATAEEILAFNAATAASVTSLTNTVNTKITTYYQTTAPSETGPVTGDLWIDTDDGNRIYRFDSTKATGQKWVSTQFGNGAIVDNSINGVKLVANTITAEKVSIGTFSPNAIPNHSFEDLQQTAVSGTPVGMPARWFFDTGTGYTGATYAVNTSLVRSGQRAVTMTNAANNSARMYNYDIISVAAGEQWYLAAAITAAATTSGSAFELAAFWYGPSNNYLSSTVVKLADVTTANAWQRVEGTVTVPSNATGMRIGLMLRSSASSRSIVVDMAEANSVVSRVRIADGAISAEKLTISVGGGNLLSNSGFENPTWTTNYSAVAGSHVQHDVVTTEKRSGSRSFRFTIKETTLPGGSTDWSHYYGLRQTAGAYDNGPLTCSAWVKGPAGKRFLLRATRVVDGTWQWGGGASADASTTIDLTGSWQRITLILQPFTGAGTTTGVGLRWSPIQGGTALAVNDEFFLDDVQAESGDVVTSYSPRADEILPGRVTGTEIAGDTISTGHITTSGLDAGVIKFGTMHGDRITTATLHGDKITAGTLDADRIKANSVFGANAGVSGSLVLGYTPTFDGSGNVTNPIVPTVANIPEIRSVNYSTAGAGAGYRITDSGIDIRSGNIAAGLIQVQNSPNILPREYSLFEQPSVGISRNGTTTGSSFVLSTAQKIFGTQSLLLTATTTAAASTTFNLSENNVTYNLPLEQGKRYVYSAWVYPTNAFTLTMGRRYGDGTTANFTAARIEDGSTTLALNTWQRVYVALDTVTANGGNVYFNVPTDAQFYVDGVQVEEMTSTAGKPSTYKPGGYTTIDAGMIKTGSLQSTQNVTIDGTTQPRWSLNMGGNMQINDAIIRGSVVVGSASSTTPGAVSLQSYNWNNSSLGWAIKGDGTVDFFKGTFRDNLKIGAAGSEKFHVDGDTGNLGIGGTSSTSGDFRVTGSDGSVYIGKGSLSVGQTFSVTSDGRLTTTNASIAGWEIDSSKITRGSGTTEVGIASTGNPFWAGGTQTGAQFRVEADGTLRASSAIVTGTINASGGTVTGTLGVTGTIRAGSATANNFHVDITGGAITGYSRNASNVATTVFRISGLSGNILRGAVISDSSLTGTTSLQFLEGMSGSTFTLTPKYESVYGSWIEATGGGDWHFKGPGIVLGGTFPYNGDGARLGNSGTSLTVNGTAVSLSGHTHSLSAHAHAASDITSGMTQGGTITVRRDDQGGGGMAVMSRNYAADRNAGFKAHDAYGGVAAILKIYGPGGARWESRTSDDGTWADHLAGTHHNMSDPRLKDDMVPVSSGFVEKSKNLKLYRFDFLPNEQVNPRDRLGIDATDLPDLVSTLVPTPHGEMVSVDTAAMDAFLLGCIKELIERVEELESGKPRNGVKNRPAKPEEWMVDPDRRGNKNWGKVRGGFPGKRPS